MSAACLTGATAYRISLLEVQTVDGAPAFHLRLAARQDASVHPLTDVFVDERNDPAIQAKSSVMMPWLIASGSVEATIHAYFRTVSGSVTFASSNVTLPSS
ncbi:MAG: hypothetical protein ACYDCA_09090 [Candidatus Tyrphobacter sp.]